MKKIVALVLAAMMLLSLAACSNPEGELAGDLNNDGQIEMGQDGVDVEVNVSDVHMDAAEASASGNWEALFTPVEVEGRAIDMKDFDLTPTAEEKAAMEKEPAYGQPIIYMMSDGCTSGPTVADDLKYYTEAGLTAEGVKGMSIVEALGTQQATVAVGHIATMLVPITNGVDLTFVGGAHIGCKSLYVLADSEYKTTADLKGTKISTPNGIGKSDYNITALLLDADGIHYKNDVVKPNPMYHLVLKTGFGKEIHNYDHNSNGHIYHASCVDRLINPSLIKGIKLWHTKLSYQKASINIDENPHKKRSKQEPGKSIKYSKNNISVLIVPL